MTDRIGCEELNYRIATTEAGLDTGYLFLRDIPMPTTQVFKNFAGTFSQSEGGQVQHGCSNVTLTWTELTPKQAHWIRKRVDTALDGSRQLYLTIKANDAQKVDYDWIDYVGTPHPVDFGEGGTMPGIRGRFYQNCTLFVNCLSVVFDPTTGDPTVTPPNPCTSTFNGIYPDVVTPCPGENWCWQEIENITYISDVGAFGQTYNIVDKTVEVQIPNHPGNQFFGFIFEIDNIRPPNAYGLAITTEIIARSDPLLEGRIGTTTMPNPLLSGGGTVTPDDNETYLAYVDDLTNPVTNCIETNVVPLFDYSNDKVHDVPDNRNQIYLGFEAAIALAGASATILYKDFAWLIKQ